MEYPTYGVPWNVICQRTRRDSEFAEWGSTGTASPPPSPMTPTSPCYPEYTGLWEEMDMLSTESNNSVANTVPYLLGLPDSTPVSLAGASSNIAFKSGNHHYQQQQVNPSGGFYKRLYEWLQRKKKTRRRHSDTAASTSSQNSSTVISSAVAGSAGLLGVQVASGRFGNRKSAPMIFTCSTTNDKPSSDLAKKPTTSTSQTTPIITRVVDMDASASFATENRINSLGGLATWPSQESTSDELLPHCCHSFPPTSPVEAGKLPEGAGEWGITWQDMEFGEHLIHGRHCRISRGRWHGDVTIHTFRLEEDGEVDTFWRQVGSLSLLRHDNLMLFMAASSAAPHYYAIVHSAPRGVSLHQYRVTKPDSLSTGMAISISRQVGNAMGYLHARKIIHGKLHPDNIFLEGENCRVKISLVDYGISDVTQHKPGYGCLPKRQIGYWSPQLLRGLVAIPPEVSASVGPSKLCDVYAFGSLLYDLIQGSPPVHTDVETFIWRTCKGLLPSLQPLQCTPRLKSVILACWELDPDKRPTFIDLVRRLQPAVSLCRSHSTSEPERLNRFGTCRLAC